MRTRTNALAPVRSTHRFVANRNEESNRNLQKHVVRNGDTLSHIAKKQQVSLDDLIKANPQLTRPDRIYPGQEINLPAARMESRENSANTNGYGDHYRREAGESLAPGGMSTSNSRVLRRGARGSDVASLQASLQRLGFNPGTTDGQYGPKTQMAVRRFQVSQGIRDDGVVGPGTWQALQTPRMNNRLDGSGVAGIPPSPGPNPPRLQTYPPFSDAAKALFGAAADRAGVPRAWAQSNGLHQILRKESRGRVGVPNYTYGSRARDPSRWPQVWNELKNDRITARSSATGLGQLLLDNVERYYPSGRAGIGDPMEEAVGMLKYIKDRYGHPDNAWRLYGTRHEGY